MRSVVGIAVPRVRSGIWIWKLFGRRDSEVVRVAEGNWRKVGECKAIYIGLIHGDDTPYLDYVSKLWGVKIHCYYIFLCDNGEIVNTQSREHRDHWPLMSKHQFRRNIPRSLMLLKMIGNMLPDTKKKPISTSTCRAPEFLCDK